MMLKEVLKDCDYSKNKDHQTPREIPVSGIAYDSRQVKDGFIFVAIKGRTVDGHVFIPDALRKGAVVVVHEDTNPEAGANRSRRTKHS